MYYRKFKEIIIKYVDKENVHDSKYITYLPTKEKLAKIIKKDGKK